MLDTLDQLLSTAEILAIFLLKNRKEAHVFLSLRRLLVAMLLVCTCIGTSPHAHADIAHTSDSKAVGVIVAVVAVAAVAGFGLYYAVHHGHSLKGCTAASASGLTLTTDGGQDTYTLSGDVQGIRPGDRIRVEGSKAKNGSTGKSFVVTKLSKDYGACRTS